MSIQFPSDLAVRVLRLEQKLESYQRLHAEELENIRQALQGLKEQVLAITKDQASTTPSSDSKDD
jgi:hypothetical protein